MISIYCGDLASIKSSLKYCCYFPNVTFTNIIFLYTRFIFYINFSSCFFPYINLFLHTFIPKVIFSSRLNSKSSLSCLMLLYIFLLSTFHHCLYGIFLFSIYSVKFTFIHSIIMVSFCSPFLQLNP